VALVRDQDENTIGRIEATPDGIAAYDNDSRVLSNINPG
jgi:hypothetical protein